jgi:hypothetical protein
MEATKLVQVFDNEEYVGTAFIEGVKFVKGEYGWFTTLELLLLSGEKIDGFSYSIYPYTPMLEFLTKETGE